MTIKGEVSTKDTLAHIRHGKEVFNFIFIRKPKIVNQEK
jgi:hypothetical protein